MSRSRGRCGSLSSDARKSGSPRRGSPRRGALKSLSLCLFVVLLSGCDPEGHASSSPTTNGAPAAGATPHSGAAATGNSTSGRGHELPGELTLEAGDGAKRRIAVEKLARDPRARVIESDDPYYGKLKKYRAVRLLDVLGEHLGAPLEELKGKTFVLVARDGYRVQIEGERLLRPEVHLAFFDADHGSWQPIGPRGDDPGPLYLVWEGRGFTDTDLYPHPWALTTIAVEAHAPQYPHAQPPAGFGDDRLAARGHELFLRRCIRCHAVNREGGRLGPDLNVPQNILQYRPLEQVRAYVRDPLTFRYGAMPPNPDLSDADLDALVAYLAVMGQNQHDPDRGSAPPAHPAPPPESSHGSKGEP